MPELKQNTKATMLHGQTGQETEDTTLPAGTPYTYEGLGKIGVYGEQYATILVDGYRYRVRLEATC